MLHAVAEPRGISAFFSLILIVQNHIQQRLVNADAVFVFDKPEIPKAIHEEGHTRAGGSDMLHSIKKSLSK
jgi:hypothetical protein